MNEQINELADKYKTRKAFLTGAKSVGIILTGLIEAGKEYITWKEEDMIFLKEKLR